MSLTALKQFHFKAPRISDTRAIKLEHKGTNTHQTIRTRSIFHLITHLLTRLPGPRFFIAICANAPANWTGWAGSQDRHLERTGYCRTVFHRRSCSARTKTGCRKSHQRWNRKTDTSLFWERQSADDGVHALRRLIPRTTHDNIKFRNKPRHPRSRCKANGGPAEWILLMVRFTARRASGNVSILHHRYIIACHIQLQREKTSVTLRSTRSLVERLCREVVLCLNSFGNHMQVALYQCIAASLYGMIAYVFVIDFLPTT